MADFYKAKRFCTFVPNKVTARLVSQHTLYENDENASRILCGPNASVKFAIPECFCALHHIRAEQLYMTAFVTYCDHVEIIAINCGAYTLR